MAPSRPLTIATHAVHADTIALLCQRCEVDVCELPPLPEALAARAARASALLVFMPDRVDVPLLDACRELRIVAGAFKGADNVDVEACTARGVWVTVVSYLLSASTAELAVGLIIAVARRIREGDAAIRGGQFALPLTPATHELIDAERLALMPAGAVLVNVGRGSTVDEQAVAAALESGRLAGYGADVFAMEDRSREEAPTAIAPTLLDHPRSVFTPHLGSAVAEVRRNIELRAAESILQALDGEQPEGAINSPSIDAQ